MSGGVRNTLALHYNGSTWSLATTPNFGNDDNIVESVDAAGTGDVWAVGYYVDFSGTRKTLTMHWNGATWVYTGSPNSGTGDNMRFRHKPAIV